ncbi:MAG TPA: hypothetical protein PK569_02100 [Thermoanaerobaculia bacterium]|nr:hypothetical protein [Thermoanaerobaculia bacterium]
MRIPERTPPRRIVVDKPGATLFTDSSASRIRTASAEPEKSSNPSPGNACEGRTQARNRLSQDAQVRVQPLASDEARQTPLHTRRKVPKGEQRSAAGANHGTDAPAHL